MKGRRRKLSGVAGAYSSWRAAKERCSYPGHASYASYGGRGIKVCTEWVGKGGFARFLAFMGPRPEGASIDRIDSNGNYEPGNVRWASAKTQANNIRPEFAEARRKRLRSWRTRRWTFLAHKSLEMFGRVLGFRATELLMHRIQEDLEAAFGPPRNMEEPRQPFSIESAYLTADYGWISEHWDGLENLAREWRGHGDWSQLTGRKITFRSGHVHVEAA